MKKYKLIHKVTNEEILCDKVTLDGFDYYQTDNVGKGILIDKCYYIYNNERLCRYDERSNPSAGSASYNKKVISTNDFKIDLPKVIDKIEEMAYDRFQDDGIHNNRDWQAIGFIKGYQKSQETNPFSEEDMIEFSNFSLLFKDKHKYADVKDLFQIWKESKPEIVYYK